MLRLAPEQEFRRRVGELLLTYRWPLPAAKFGDLGVARLLFQNAFNYLQRLVAGVKPERYPRVMEVEMNVNRRSFFGVAVASPFAAKEAAKKVIEQAADHAVERSELLQRLDLHRHFTSSVNGPMRSLWEAIRDMGVPDWKREDLREDSRRSRTLDPDLAAMKSFSLSAKMRMQWQRNYNHLVERALRQSQMERVKRAFSRRTRIYRNTVSCLDNVQGRAGQVRPIFFRAATCLSPPAACS